MTQTNFVLLVMYDVSMDDAASRKAYRHLFFYLKKAGFYPLQASIYVKPLSEKHKAKYYIEKIKTMVFEKAHIRSLLLTHNNFLAMEAVLGEDSMVERLIKQPNSVIRI